MTIPDVLRLEIISGAGVEVFDPNSLALAVMRKRAFTPAAGQGSDVSSEPALIYRTFEFECRLTPAELNRMVRRALRPTEVHKLIDKHGMRFEWHEDFYDEDGEALQPHC